MTSSLATLNLTGDLTYLAVPVRIATPTSQKEQQPQALLLPPVSEDGNEAEEAEAQLLPPLIPPPPLLPSSADAVTQTASSEENLVNENCDSNCVVGNGEDVLDVRFETPIIVASVQDTMSQISLK